MARIAKVACFHGGGSNSEVFNIQAIRLQNIVAKEIEFVYFNGPFESNPGPGVLPVFEDYGPFWSWIKNRQLSWGEDDGSGFDSVGTDGLHRAWKMMESRAPREDWVGVMGFSQGTRMAGGLLLDQQRRAARNESNGFKLRFGIMCMGGGSPLVTKEYKTTNEQAENANFELITLPTLHLHGLKDEYLGYGRRQKENYYSPDTSTLCEIEYHHAMPWNQEDLERFSGLVKKLYEDTRESSVVSASTR
ncbi:putative phospholipase/carboxylesterase [Viridothelium virens]|uniref:Putative phospholipase/carboxylesterase n=1 Tax=Viridothelium virens TaxID=1048519 RepID=A0A6A6HPV7_VIRVR|nr:putative phospholipase/carboxylesterase [Viridothelium virens]